VYNTTNILSIRPIAQVWGLSGQKIAFLSIEKYYDMVCYNFCYISRYANRINRTMHGKVLVEGQCLAWLSERPDNIFEESLDRQNFSFNFPMVDNPIGKNNRRFTLCSGNIDVSGQVTVRVILRSGSLKRVYSTSVEI